MINFFMLYFPEPIMPFYQTNINITNFQEKAKKNIKKISLLPLSSVIR
jgi:hypothetical protein